MTDTGDYYIGSATDFSSSDHAIYRMSGSGTDSLKNFTIVTGNWVPC
jgi:hypothetical protein